MKRNIQQENEEKYSTITITSITRWFEWNTNTRRHRKEINSLWKQNYINNTTIKKMNRNIRKRTHN